MICKNGNQIEVNFGFNDILVTPLYEQERRIGGISFKNASNASGIVTLDDYDVSDDSVILAFNDEKSIDDIINKLNFIKQYLNQFNSQV